MPAPYATKCEVSGCAVPSGAYSYGGASYSLSTLRNVTSGSRRLSAYVFVRTLRIDRSLSVVHTCFRPQHQVYNTAVGVVLVLELHSVLQRTRPRTPLPIACTLLKTAGI
jgi:hypothetical protein